MFNRFVPFLKGEKAPSNIYNRYVIWDSLERDYKNARCPDWIPFGFSIYFQLVDNPDYIYEFLNPELTNNDYKAISICVKMAGRIIGGVMSREAGGLEELCKLRTIGYFNTGILPKKLELFFRELIDRRHSEIDYPSPNFVRDLVKKHGVENYIYDPFIKSLELEERERRGCILRYTDKLLDPLDVKHD